MSLRAMALLAAAALFAGAAHAMPVPDYLAQTLGADLFERQAARFMLLTSGDGRVQSFAHMMIADHKASTGMVRAAALEAGIAPPPAKLSPDQAYMLRALHGAFGTRRDMLYLAQQRTAHRAALATQQNEAATPEAPALAAVAAKLVPVVRQHLLLLDSIHTP